MTKKSDEDDASAGSDGSGWRQHFATVLPKRVRRNLIAKLVLLLLVWTVLSGGLLFVSYTSITNEITDQVETQIESDTTTEAIVYENWLSERWTSLHQIAQSGEMQHSSSSVVHQWLTAEETRIVSDVHSLHVADADTGEILGSTETKYHGDNVFAMGLNETTGGRLLFISQQPITLDPTLPDMTLVGVRSNDRILIGAVPANTSIVDSDSYAGGTSSLYSMEGHQILGDRESLQLPASLGTETRVIAQGDSVVGATVIAHDLLDAQPVTEYDKATTAGTIAVSQVPAAEAFAIRDQISRDLLLLFGLLFTLFVGTAAVSMRGVTVDLNRLSNQAEKISEGSLDVEVSSRRIDEIGRLYQSVEEMRDSLQKRLEQAEKREQELQAREEKYRSLFEDSRDALQLLDRDGYLDCNAQTLDLFGIESTEEFVNRSPWELSPAQQPDGGDSKAVAIDHIETAFEEGEAFFEWTHQRPDDTTFPAEIKLSRFETQGKPRIHALVRDITERKAYETALEQAREELRQIIDLVPDPIFVKNRNGEYLLANEATADAFGTTAEDLEGKQATTVIPNVADSEGFREDDRAVLESGEPMTVIEELTTASGERRIYQTTRIPFDSVESDDPVVLGYARDVTNLKEYEQQLETQRDNLDILNQVVRHDIRNDLQIVLAYGDMLEDYVEDDGQEYLNNALEAAHDAVDITTTARDVTEVMLKSERDMQPMDLRPVLEDEIDDAQTNYENALIEVDGSIPAVEVLADDMLPSVFRNLLNNAVVHNDADIPEISVTASATEDTVTVRIADNGPGIPDERKEEIFEQGEMGLDSEGTGLGLYLVDTLVDRYGGSAHVEDNDPTGAVLIVELPVRS